MRWCSFVEFQGLAKQSMVLSSGFVEINAFVRKKQIFHSVALLGLLCRKERRETINLDGGQTNSLNNYGKIACFPLSFVLWRHWHSVSIAGGAFDTKLGTSLSGKIVFVTWVTPTDMSGGRKLTLMTQSTEGETGVGDKTPHSIALYSSWQPEP